MAAAYFRTQANYGSITVPAKSNPMYNLACILLIAETLLSSGVQKAMAQGEGVTMGPSGQMITGKLQFRRYCAQCHGLDGTGNGPVASALKKKPANLTTLAKKNAGVFPEEQVREYIDGRKTVASHGAREMPIWGNEFMYRQGGSGGPGAPALTEAQVNHKIDLLVRYVKSIQTK
jgi:mono/diheme cytochrome c family protein